MVHIIRDPRSRTSQAEYLSRLDSMMHLTHASPDINDWEFKKFGRPSWAAKTCHHIFQGRCKKSGVKQDWLIDRSEADYQGSFEARHKEIIEAFTQSLIYLKNFVQEVQRRRALGEKGIVLPNNNIDLEALAKKDLHRGDHPNDFA